MFVARAVCRVVQCFDDFTVVAVVVALIPQLFHNVRVADDAMRANDEFGLGIPLVVRYVESRL